jgi:hypothetical protein
VNDVLALGHPANAAVLAHLRRHRESGTPASRSPDSVPQPYLTLGTHPDVVERLWDKVTSLLPEPCRWVVYDTPALVHPGSGVVFGFATGVPVYALRLPAPELEEALAAGAKREFVYSRGPKLDLAKIGADWVLGSWHKDEPRWVLAGYEWVGTLT